MVTVFVLSYSLQARRRGIRATLHSVVHEKSTHTGNCSFVPVVASGSNSASCIIAKVLLVGEDMDSGTAFLSEVAHEADVHKLLIESIGMEPHEFGLLVDRFLTTSPWWVVGKEVYGHRHLDGQVNSTVHLIALHRYQVRYETQLRHLAAKQYPPSQSVCESTPVHIGRMINSGWGSQMMFATKEGQFPYSVFNIWYTNNNTASESMLTCHADDCRLYPGTVNKWECVFLPLTNCSLHQMPFTKCHFFEYKPGWGRVCFPWEFAMYSNMTERGSIDMKGAVGKRPITSYQLEVDRRYPISRNPHVVASPNFILADGEVVTTRGVQSHDLLTLFGSIFRPNYNLRSRVAIKLAELEADKHIPFPLGRTECVAVHIRRGDRTREMNISMTEFCAMYKAGGVERDNCNPFRLSVANANIPKELGLPLIGSCQDLVDIGCFYAHPFGALTLVDYLQRAQLLVPSARAAFVMTDDGPWLDDQVKNLARSTSNVSTWQVGSLSAPAPSRFDQNGTRYTTDFWASVMAARQCAGFVGHWGSGVAQFVFAAMCFQHGEYTGVCPPASDIGVA